MLTRPVQFAAIGLFLLILVGACTQAELTTTPTATVASTLAVVPTPTEAPKTPTPTEVKPTSTPESTPTPEKPSFTFAPDGVYTGTLENGGTMIIFTSSIDRQVGTIIHKQNIPCTGPLSSTEVLYYGKGQQKEELNFSSLYGSGVLTNPTEIEGKLNLPPISTSVQGQTLVCEQTKISFKAVYRGRGEDVLIDKYLEIFGKTKQFFAPSSREEAKQTLIKRLGSIFSE